MLFTRLPDRPGKLARLLDCVAGEGANIVDVSHVREGVDLHVRETAVELVHRDARPRRTRTPSSPRSTGAGYDTASCASEVYVSAHGERVVASRRRGQRARGAS